LHVAMSGKGAVEQDRGCPQGSVLGPLLWVVSYNFVIEGLQSPMQKVICYTDDTILLHLANRKETVQDMVSESTDLAMALLRKAELNLNKEKLEILVFRGSDLSNTNTEITFDAAGERIVSKSSIKYLGVYVDTKLTFEEHYK